MNQLIIIGNVGKDPEIKTFDNGGSVANFSVGCTERGYKTKDGKEIPDHTEWFLCRANGGLVKVISSYVHKGTKVGIRGKVHTREYDKDGQKARITEVIVEDLELLSPKADGQAPATSPAVATAAFAEEKQDDLPF